MSRPTAAWGAVVPIPPATVAKATKLKNKAILADVCGVPRLSPDFSSVHHRQLNVFYGNRSAKPVPLNACQAIQSQIELLSASGPQPTTFHIDETYPNANALWNAFDRQ